VQVELSLLERHSSTVAVVSTHEWNNALDQIYDADFQHCKRNAKKSRWIQNDQIPTE
jgi:hypothetical protein